MTCRLSTDQLRSQAEFHRKMAAQGTTPTHSTHNIEEQTAFYTLTQTLLAEVYEELLEHREAAKVSSSVPALT